MIRSMTGYGSAELERDGQRLVAEIRSVNHRFCEVSIRAPKLVSLFEDQIRQLIQERFSRGKITIGITWSGAGESGEVLSLNTPVVEKYVTLLQQLRDRYKLNADLNVGTLATLPDVFTWEHTALSDEQTWSLVKAVVDKACENMNAMKAREGEALARDLDKRLKILQPVLEHSTPVCFYEKGTWGPPEADELIAPRKWHVTGVHDAHDYMSRAYPVVPEG